MSKSTLNILKALLLTDLLLAVISLIFFDIKVLYNTQVGFISSTLVMFASIISYRRMVNTRVEHNIITVDDSKDVIDQLEDPYDLYSEEVVESDEPDLVETVKEEQEEKDKLKNNGRTLYQTLKDTKAALSVYRLGAYVLLILGFLYLNRHELLHIPSYIVALGLPSLIIAVMLLRKENK